MSIDAHESIWYLDLCRIWSENSKDGIGRWTEPSEHDMEYIDFYLEAEYSEDYGDYAGEKIADYDDNYIMELLRLLFPQLKER